MVTKRKASGKAYSFPAGLTMGVVISVLLTVALSLLLAKLLDQEVILWESVGYGIAGMIIISSYLGSTVSIEMIKRQRVVVSVLSGSAYYGALLSIAALFFGGQFEAMGVTAALVLAGCGVSILTRTNPKNKRRGKGIGKNYC